MKKFNPKLFSNEESTQYPNYHQGILTTLRMVVNSDTKLTSEQKRKKLEGHMRGYRYTVSKESKPLSNFAKREYLRNLN